MIRRFSSLKPTPLRLAVTLLMSCALAVSKAVPVVEAAMPNINRRVEEIGKEVRRQAQESWALLYPIRYKTEQAIGELPAQARRPFPSVIRVGSPSTDTGRELFEQIATASGGDVFEWTNQHDLNSAIKNVLGDLRSQYALGYTPVRKTQNGFRRIRVRVKRPNLVVRTREGYFYNGEKR